MMKTIAVKVYLDNGNNFVTSINIYNGDARPIINYFLGKKFEQSDETMAKCIKLVFLNDDGIETIQ